jgi:molybdate transport system regulatory protein
MSTDNTRFTIRSKIWIADDHGKVVFGLGRYRILDAIDRSGSLQAAARELKMSYRAVWCRIKASEERIGRALVERKGKGSQLTAFAEDLMKQFRRLQAVVEKESDEMYATLMDETLAAAETDSPSRKSSDPSR